MKIKRTILFVSIIIQSLISSLPVSSQDVLLYPGWEDDAWKTKAFEACMYDYGLPIDKSLKARSAYTRTLSGSTNMDHWIKLEQKYRVVKSRDTYLERLNFQLSRMSDTCFDYAKRYGSSMPKIDYAKDGNYGWEVVAQNAIAFEKCLETSNVLSGLVTKRILVNEYLNAGTKITRQDMANVLLRKDLASQLEVSIRMYGPGSKTCAEKINHFEKSYRIEK